MYQERTAYIDELTNFINSSKNRFNSVLKTINWTKQSLLSGKDVESLQNSGDMHVAGHNLSHRQEETVVEGQVYIMDMHYGNPLGTISFLQHTSGGGDHLYSDIVASLLVSDQTIKTEKKDIKTEDKAAALIQLLKMERDAKRRRISYKNKVHTKNKSHTEVLREVLEEQMLTITGASGNDSASTTNDRLQPSMNHAQDLIAIRPPQGNPHLAWLDILENAEGGRKQADHHQKSHKSVYSSHNKHSVSQKEKFRYDEEKDRKKHHKDKRRKYEDKDMYRDKERMSEWDDYERISSPSFEERHHKRKKKKRSRSRSPITGVSNHHKHKSNHKKKKH